MCDETRIRNAVLGALRQPLVIAGLDPNDIDNDFDILGSGIIDSLAFVDLLLAVEAELGSQLELELLDFDDVTSLGALMRILHRILVPA